MPRGPRIFCIAATAAPVLAVLRRGPSPWFHIGRWNAGDQSYEPGAWFRGRLFPQKCDISPDGRWLAYSAHKPKADWPAGEIYEAISRLPWLHALAAWEAGTTYTRGIRFDEEAGRSDIGAPDVGDDAPCLRRFGIRLNRAQQFAVERRRGWIESDDTEPRSESDSWDERRRVFMEKRRPGGDIVLRVGGSYAAFRDSPQLRDPARYEWIGTDGVTALDDVQWADWDARGRLLVATRKGVLQVREEPAGPAVVEHDLSGLGPDPAPPPDRALEW